jgi:hypothetical protein
MITFTVAVEEVWGLRYQAFIAYCEGVHLGRAAKRLAKELFEALDDGDMLADLGIKLDTQPEV